MIREFQLADWFTIGNAICGTGALFSMMTYLQKTDVSHVYLACGLVAAALFFDVLDGRIKPTGFTLHPPVLLFAISGSLMISRIRFPKR